MQTWKIKGKTYNHGQLMELKRQNLDPIKDEIVMSSVTKKNQPEMEVPEVEKKEISNVKYEEMKFFTLKKIAREKGMVLTNETKKEDVLEYLNA